MRIGQAFSSDSKKVNIVLLQQGIAFLKKRAFALLVLSFLALRLGTLLTSVEYTSGYWYIEELYQGTIAKELIEGLKVPLWDYKPEYYHGGCLWVGGLAIPFFLLFGPNLFALKLVPLLFSLATLILTYFFFKRFFDRKTALLVSALLVLPPPVFTGLSLSVAGSYPESILFAIAMLFCLYQFLYGEKNKPLFLILFGLVSGLGFWFSPITLLTLFACLTSWFFLDRPSLLSRKFLVFLVALGIGGFPFILYNAKHAEEILRLIHYVFLSDGQDFTSLGKKLLYLPVRMAALLFETLPLVFRFRSFFGISGRLLSGVYGLGVMFLVLPFFWREGRKL